MPLSEAQQDLATLIESTINETIEGIGEPRLDGDLILVDFQYGSDVYSATIDPDKGELTY